MIIKLEIVKVNLKDVYFYRDFYNIERLLQSLLIVTSF